jgi:hypothetical protein
MPTMDCSVEDQDKRFQIDLSETPRTGEYISRGGTIYVIASVTWEVARRGQNVKLVLREIPPEP